MNLKRVVISLFCLQATASYSNDNKEELAIVQGSPENSIADLISKLNKNNKIEIKSQTEISIIDIGNDDFKARLKNIFTNYLELTVIATTAIVSSIATFSATIFYKKTPEKMIDNSANSNKCPGSPQKSTDSINFSQYPYTSDESESSDNDPDQSGKRLPHSLADNNENIPTPMAKNNKNPIDSSLQRLTRLGARR